MFCKNLSYTPKYATLIATLTALCLAIGKLVVGAVSGSVAVLASAIDSLLDVGISIFNFFALKKSEKPADSRFNYGLGKLESLAATFEGLVIALSGVYIFYTSCVKLISSHEIESLQYSLGMMIFSFCITFCLVWYLQKVAKKTNSQVIKADVMHYKVDLLSNGVILCSLAVISVSGFDKLDAILGIGIALYIMFSAFRLMRESVLLLLDRAIDPHIFVRVQEVLENAPITSYHALRSRIVGNIIFLDVHLVFHPDITLLEAHRISNSIEEHIRALDVSLIWEINAHLDPYDDSEFDVISQQGRR
ncbi:cation diffusion facilitator family transporter [uncultured Helicobacter sp.]|uniref:cation diffusion facilitator family transporter n=1 Tax=uncultured Helicobacter sp. TaxID=175537 RepID=UPI00374FAF03